MGDWLVKMQILNPFLLSSPMELAAFSKTKMHPVRAKTPFFKKIRLKLEFFEGLADYSEPPGAL